MAEKAPHLRNLSRFITDHDTGGKAVFNKDVGEQLEPSVVGQGDKFFLGYATSQFPTNFTKDISDYQAYQTKAPGITIPGGTVLRIVDIRPGGTSPMHRTVSLDYGVVLEGEIELTLDSGESRVMRRGDTAIQRGTMHAWRNCSDTEWGRMLFVLQESKPVEINGKALPEDYGVGMNDVRPSGPAQ